MAAGCATRTPGGLRTRSPGQGLPDGRSHAARPGSETVASPSGAGRQPVSLRNLGQGHQSYEAGSVGHSARRPPPDNDRQLAGRDTQVETIRSARHHRGIRRAYTGNRSAILSRGTRRANVVRRRRTDRNGWPLRCAHPCPDSRRAASASSARLPGRTAMRAPCSCRRRPWGAR